MIIDHSPGDSVCLEGICDCRKEQETRMGFGPGNRSDRRTQIGPPPEGFRQSLTDPRPAGLTDTEREADKQASETRQQEKIEALRRAVSVDEDDDFWADRPWPTPAGQLETVTDPYRVEEEDDTTVDVVPVESNRNGAEVRTVSSTGGEKGQKLARFDLIPVGPLTELAKHYGRGARKYADRNWEKGYEWSKNYAALQRHLFAFWDGEDIDEETGTPHIVAVAWHAFALAEFMNTHPEFDDRPKRG